jgi:non-specific serine/threonine protein kinase
VPPLDIPGLDVLAHTSLLTEYSAIELFLERVQAVRPNLTLTPENGVSIAQICARLDGLPLALELAAARTKVLPPEQLLERLLEEPFSLLTGGAKSLPRKQQTLRNTLEWSYHLLSPIEQQCFARLGIFTGSWSLEAAKAVLQVGRGSAEQEPPLVAGSYLDILEQLVDSSLLIQQPAVGGQVRFTMLETLREYARERLAALGELEKLRDWHARYYLRVAEAATAGLQSESSPRWQARLLAEQQNLRAALEWSSQRTRERTSINDPSISAPRTMEELSAVASIRNALSENGSTS